MSDIGPELVISLQTFAQMLGHRYAAIKLCFASNLLREALILMYVTMDHMASFDRSPGKPSVDRKDFCDWVRRYVIPHLDGAFTAEDLYGARCGMLHDCSSESDHSRSKKATPILYSFGERTEAELEELIERCRSIDPSISGQKVMHVGKLANALQLGISIFIAEIRQDRDRQLRVLRHARQILSLESEPLEGPKQPCAPAG